MTCLSLCSFLYVSSLAFVRHTLECENVSLLVSLVADADEVVGELLDGVGG